MRKPFRFKNFSLFQDKTAMKIGTDGVLLGAWAIAKNPRKILDIGTGTGLIALMCAQRFPEAFVTAIEIEENAYHQAKENIELSEFLNRLTLFHTSFQEFETEDSFDFIISNPPFFQITDIDSTDPRKIARQHNQLNFSDLLHKTSQLLTSEGNAFFIIPFEEEENFIEIGQNHQLYATKITRVKGHENANIKRSLIQFTKAEVSEILTDEITIEKERHQYTEAYIKLTSSFYLKM